MQIVDMQGEWMDKGCCLKNLFRIYEVKNAEFDDFHRLKIFNGFLKFEFFASMMKLLKIASLFVYIQSCRV